MAVIVLTHAEVERLMPVSACIEVMADALASFAHGEYAQPLRSVYAPPQAGGMMAWMPAYRSGPAAAYGMKILCIVPDNPERGLDAHQGAVVLLDSATGELRGLINASAITAIRTAAVSAVATRLLAREDAHVLALLGAGVQARWHLEAITQVRNITEVRVASRTYAGAQAFVEKMRPVVSCAIEAVVDAEHAVRSADIVVTATTSRAPIIERSWLAAGVHINAIGASRPTHREIDTATWVDSSVFVDSRNSVEHEAGDYQEAQVHQRMGLEHIKAELGELLIGQARGRVSREELTLFRSLGLAIEDVAAAVYVLHEANHMNVGTIVEW